MLNKFGFSPTTKKDRALNFLTSSSGTMTLTGRPLVPIAAPPPPKDISITPDAYHRFSKRRRTLVALVMAEYLSQSKSDLAPPLIPPAVS